MAPAADDNGHGFGDVLMAPIFGERSITPERLWWGLAVGVLLAFAFGLRIWGVDHGLPYAYNADENAHFVTRAIGLFGHGWDPQYYVNPPAYTYLAHLLLGVWYGGRDGRLERLRRRPDADLGPDARPRRGPRDARDLADLPRRRAPRRPPRRPARRRASSRSRSCRSSTPSSRSTTCRRSRRCAWRCGARRASCASGRQRDYVIAGIGLGLACATKYTGGIVLLPLVAAAVVQFTAPGGRVGRRARDRDRGRRGAARVPRRQPVRDAQLGRVRQRAHAPVRRLRRRRRQARPDAGQRLPLLPVVLRLGARLGAAVLRGRRRRAAVVRRAAAVLGARPGRARCSCCSWARRSATSGAGSCRSSRSSASSRRTRRSSSSTAASATRRR